MPKIDVPETTAPVKTRSITMPEWDIFDQPFPTIRLGRLTFEAGVTYQLTEPIASTLAERIKAWEDADRRLLQPRRDKAAMRVQANSGRSQGLQQAE